MKRIFTTVLLCVVLVTSLIAQEYDYVKPDSLPSRESRSTLQLPIKAKESKPAYYVPSYANEGEKNQWEEEESDSPVKKKQNRTSVNVELGSSVSSDFNGNTAINTYVAPHVRYQVDDRIAISGGVMMSQTYLDGWTNYSIDGGPMPKNIYSNTVYGRLDYMVNDKLMVYGSVSKNLTTIPDGPFTRQLDGVSYTLGMEYKMSERSFLQIQVHQSSGFNPYNPYAPRYNSFGFGGRPINYFP